MCRVQSVNSDGLCLCCVCVCVCVRRLAKRKELGAKFAAEKDEKTLSTLAAALSLAGALPKDELAFIQTGDNFKHVMNVLNAIVDDGKLFPLTQAFLQRNLDIVIHALKFDTELHLTTQNKFQLIMCADAQFNKYYRDYGVGVDDKDPEAKETHAIRAPLSDKPDDLPSIYLIANINYFGANGGYVPSPIPTHHPPTTTTTVTRPFLIVCRCLIPPCVVLFVCFHLLSCSFEALAARLTKPQFKDSFSCTTKLISALAVIRPTLERKFAESFVASLNLPALTEQRLAKVTDEDLKTLDKEQLANLSVNVQKLLSLVMTPEKLAEFSERSQLAISLRLVNSGVLAKRLDGAQQLEAFLGALRRAGQPAPAADPAAAASSAAPGGAPIGPST